MFRRVGVTSVAEDLTCGHRWLETISVTTCVVCALVYRYFPSHCFVLNTRMNAALIPVFILGIGEGRRPCPAQPKSCALLMLNWRTDERKKLLAPATRKGPWVRLTLWLLTEGCKCGKQLLCGGDPQAGLVAGDCWIDLLISGFVQFVLENSSRAVATCHF